MLSSTITLPIWVIGVIIAFVVIAMTRITNNGNQINQTNNKQAEKSIKSSSSSNESAKPTSAPAPTPTPSQSTSTTASTTAPTSTSSSKADSKLPNLRNVQLKMMLVVRTDLGMTKGKIAAQCCHAAVAVVTDIIRGSRNQPLEPTLARHYLEHWDRNGAMKIAVKCSSEEELIAIEKAAEQHKLPHCLIHDAGHTQVAPNSATVIAIGPAPEQLLNQVTGGMKLL